MSLEVIQLEAENEKLRIENDSLRNALAERNARYWELHEAVSRLYKIIEGENRTGRANPLWRKFQTEAR